MFSIVIPVHESVDVIEENLRRLMPQLHRKDEVIVVDDNSESPSQIHKRISAHNIVFLELTKHSSYNRGSAINLGVSNASNDWIIELDQDKTPADDFYRESIKRFCLDASPEEMAFGHTLNHFSWDIKSKYIDDLGRATFNAVVGGNACYHKSLFLKVHGYDPNYDGSKGFQDFDLFYRMQRAGASFQYLKEMLTDHIDSHEVTFETYKRNMQRFRDLHGFLPEYN